MKDLIGKLFELYKQKIEAGHFEIRKIIDEELEIISKLGKEETLESNIVKNLAEKIKNLELHEEFNISIEEYQQILKEKKMEEHFHMLFSQGINDSKKVIADLKAILESQKIDINKFSLIKSGRFIGA